MSSQSSRLTRENLHWPHSNLESRPSHSEVEAAFRTIIRWAGDNPDRDGLIETPSRMARAYEEYFTGYAEDSAPWRAWASRLATSGIAIEFGDGSINSTYREDRWPEVYRSARISRTPTCSVADLMIGVPLVYKLHILLGFTIYLISPFTT